MIATTTSTRTPLAPARVALKSPTGGGLLDGAWWPRSRDLAAEFPALTDVLDPLWGCITRIAVNPMLWPVVPCQVVVSGRTVKVGWFVPEPDPHKVLLLTREGGRFDLLVVPPEAVAASAIRLMAAACVPDGRPQTATDLIAAEIARSVAVGDRRQSPEESCEYEGNATSTHAVRVIAGR
ncbi:DUF5994 family protein [Streptomyces sp. BH055]|uniref:DUF5994 family protein n=1 Tax=Streptomyces sp. BH055 TaxID=3401173 RepID=UPI003BB5E561